MSLVGLVATLLDDLHEASESTDRRGTPNWLKLGSKDSCWRCGKKFGEDVEPGTQVQHHIIPTSEGGTDTVDNKSLLCSNCHAVVHRFYLPTAKIGKRRTRDGSARIVGKFKGGITISQRLPREGWAMAACQKCGENGVVVGVTEGYWNGEGMLVFLVCSACDCKYGVPFIGTNETPAVDPISELLVALTNGFREKAGLPPDLAERVEVIKEKLTSALRDFRNEMNSEIRNAKRSGLSESDARSRVANVRQKYVDHFIALLPEAQALTEACKPYRPTEGP